MSWSIMAVKRLKIRIFESNVKEKIEPQVTNKIIEKSTLIPELAITITCSCFNANDKRIFLFYVKKYRVHL